LISFFIEKLLNMSKFLSVHLWTNPQVRKALYELALKLHSRGAIVKIATWPEEKGIDDYLAKQDDPDKALQNIEREAIDVIEFIQLGHYDDVVRCSDLK
jgi:hypothetical protein